MSRPPVQPLDPDTPQGARVAQELGELLARISVDIHRREQVASVDATEPVRVATRVRRARSTPSTARRAA